MEKAQKGWAVLQSRSVLRSRSESNGSGGVEAKANREEVRRTVHRPRVSCNPQVSPTSEALDGCCLAGLATRLTQSSYSSTVRSTEDKEGLVQSRCAGPESWRAQRDGCVVPVDAELQC